MLGRAARLAMITLPCAHTIPENSRAPTPVITTEMRPSVLASFNRALHPHFDTAVTVASRLRAGRAKAVSLVEPRRAAVRLDDIEANERRPPGLGPLQKRGDQRVRAAGAARLGMHPHRHQMDSVRIDGIGL